MGRLNNDDCIRITAGECLTPKAQIIFGLKPEQEMSIPFGIMRSFAPNDPSSATAGGNTAPLQAPPPPPAVRCIALLGEWMLWLKGIQFWRLDIIGGWFASLIGFGSFFLFWFGTNYWNGSSLIWGGWLWTAFCGLLSLCLLGFSASMAHSLIREQLEENRNNAEKNGNE